MYTAVWRTILWSMEHAHAQLRVPEVYRLMFTPQHKVAEVSCLYMYIYINLEIKVTEHLVHYHYCVLFCSVQVVLASGKAKSSNDSSAPDTQLTRRKSINFIISAVCIYP